MKSNLSLRSIASMIPGVFLLITLFLVGMPSADAQTPMERIRAEGIQHSQVMEIASQMTDRVGPRLTDSPGIRAAQARALADLKSWGVTSQLEEWGGFGRGWELTGLTAEQFVPAYGPLIAYAKAWSHGTAGTVDGEPVYFDAADEAVVRSYRGKLAGRIVLLAPPREFLSPKGTDTVER